MTVSQVYVFIIFIFFTYIYANRCGVCVVIVNGSMSVDTVCAFTWLRLSRSVVQRTFLALGEMSLCYDKYDLYTVYMSLYCQTVWSARVIEVSK